MKRLATTAVFVAIIVGSGLLVQGSQAHTDDEHPKQQTRAHHHHHHPRHLDNDEDDVHPRRHECGAPEPTLENLKNAEAIVEAFLANRRRRNLQGNNNDTKRDAAKIVIPTCFHIVKSNDTAATTTRNRIMDSAQGIQDQLDALNVAYSSASCCDPDEYWCDGGIRNCSVGTGFAFEVALVKNKNTTGAVLALSNQTSHQVNGTNRCLTHTVNSRWYNSYSDSKDEEEMKETLRVGGRNVLNIYVTGVADVYGHSTFPYKYKQYPKLDGVVINDSYLVGSNSSYRGEGDLLAHEVGHWLGLWHTFSGYGCSGSGDAISDTPVQRDSTSAYSCPIGRDSCTDDPGDDPIHNFMDYSSDVCRFEFTPGQVVQMQAQYENYRGPSAAAEGGRQVIALKPGNASEPIVLTIGEKQSYKMPIKAGDRVSCRVNGDGNSNDFYVRLGAEPDLDSYLYDCSETYGDFLSCFLTNEANETSVWVTVVADYNTEALSVMCEIREPLPAFVELVSGVPSQKFTLGSGETQLFNMTIKNAAAVTCKTLGYQGYAFLSWSFDMAPDSFSYDCYGSGDGANQTCSKPYRQGATSVWAGVSASSGTIDLVITCTAFATIDDGLEPVALTSGVVQDIGELEPLHTRVFTFDTNRLESVNCSASASSGDVDLFVRWGKEADFASYDYSSEGPVSDENVFAENLGPNEILFVSVVPLSKAIDVELNCTSKFNAKELEEGKSYISYSLSSDETELYQLKIDNRAKSSVVCAIRSDDDGDSDLYVGLDIVPDLSTGEFNCSSATAGTSNEDCVIDNIRRVKSIFVLLHSKTYTYDIYLTCITLAGDVDPEKSDTLDPNKPLAPFGLSVGDSVLYELTIRAGTDVTCTTKGSNGDADLYVRWNEAPDESVYSCASQHKHSNESCSVTNHGNFTTVYIRVVAFETFSELTLSCEEVELSSAEATTQIINSSSAGTVPGPTDSSAVGDESRTSGAKQLVCASVVLCSSFMAFLLNWNP